MADLIVLGVVVRYAAFEDWFTDEVVAKASGLRSKGANLHQADVLHQPDHQAALALTAQGTTQQILQDALVLAQEGLGFHAQPVHLKLTSLHFFKMLLAPIGAGGSQPKHVRLWFGAGGSQPKLISNGEKKKKLTTFHL